MPIFAASQQASGDLDAAGAAPQSRRVLLLGPGDAVSMQVFGQPDMSATMTVSEDGTVAVPLLGPVRVAGASTADAARRIEKALVEGRILNSPQVSLNLAVAQSQRVSVLGDVGSPGRYPIESSITILDLLAQAGGIRDTGSTTVILLRPDADGKITRYSVNVRSLMDEKSTMPTESLQGGDTIFVPKAPQFYINGEVMSPNVYRIEPGMTFLQAIARAGGVSARGSRNRFEVRRKDANGVEQVVKVKPSDPVQPDDVIRVKESIF